MTTLQVLRAALKTGAMLTMHKLDDGYHIELTTVGVDGNTVMLEIVDTRLDQAILQAGEALGALEVTP